MPLSLRALPRLLPAGAVGRAGLAPAGNGRLFTAHGDSGHSGVADISPGIRRVGQLLIAEARLMCYPTTRRVDGFSAGIKLFRQP
jgi:hypothetical protein